MKDSGIWAAPSHWLVPEVLGDSRRSEIISQPWNKWERTAMENVSRPWGNQLVQLLSADDCSFRLRWIARTCAETQKETSGLRKWGQYWGLRKTDLSGFHAFCQWIAPTYEMEGLRRKRWCTEVGNKFILELMNLPCVCEWMVCRCEKSKPGNREKDICFDIDLGSSL